MAAAICCLAVSCKDAGGGDDKASVSAKNRANTLEVYKAIESGDVSKLDSFIAKDAVDHSGEMGDIVGLDSIKKYMAAMHTQFDGLKLSIIADATDGDYEMTLGRMEGTCKMPMMGMPAGAKCNFTSADVTKIKDGMAVEHWMYMDPKDMMKMMPPQGEMDHSKMDHSKMDHSKMDSAMMK